jgi:hypothetical protein
MSVMSQCKSQLFVPYYVTWAQKELDNKEIEDIASKIIWVTIPRRKRWALHVARLRKRRGTYRFWWGDMNKRGHVEDLSVDGRII